MYVLGPAKTYKMGLSYESARSPTIKTVTGMGAIKRGFVQLKGARFLLQGPWFPLRGHWFLLQALGSPYGALFNCRIVGHSPRD